MIDFQLGEYRKLFGYLGKYRRRAVLAYFGMLTATILNLLIPQIIRDAIDFGLADGELRSLISASLLIIGIGVARAVASFSQRYNGEWLTHRIAFDLRNDFYDDVQRLPFSFHDRTQTGDLMSRATSDIAETERFIGIGLMDLLATLLLLIGVIVAMLLVDLHLALAALIPIPFLVVATIRFGGIVRPRFKRIQEQVAVLSTTMQESLTGIRVVKAFAREPYELDKFDRENDTWFQRRFRVIRLWANNWPFFTFTLSLSIFILLWFGGPRAINGSLTVGTLFAMISYVLMLNGPVQRLGFLVNLAATAGASAGRLFEVMALNGEDFHNREAHASKNMVGKVEFIDVGFAYDGNQTILANISFSVKPGQTVALMGPTGSGKSTITNLIPRFYEANKGSIRVDNIDIGQWELANLRQHIGIVLQDSFLFSATIAENIAYGMPGADQKEIIAAAKAARAHDFIQSFPEKYNTKVGERGVTLSGGQKQRVAIARALLKDPRILILDDSTSSVDTETEHLIQLALKTLMEGRTTFVIAQRLLTLKSADMILVLENGRIVQRGKHDELIEQGGLYQQIYDLQLKDQEELASLEIG